MNAPYKQNVDISEKEYQWVEISVVACMRKSRLNFVLRFLGGKLDVSVGV